MLEPNLRELYQHTEKYHSYNPALYTLLGALVKRWQASEAMEPEDTPTDEEYIPTDEEYNDVRDDRIRFLQKELAKAKAERDSWERQCRDSEQARGRALQERNETEAEIEKLRPLAKIGELVQGMAIDTKIRHHHPKVYRNPIFTAYRWDDRLMTFVDVTWSPDPAKALAAIQEGAMTEKCKLVSVPDLLRLRIRELERTVESLTADANLGKSVREMQPQTRLTRGYTYLYWVERRHGATWVSVGPQVATSNPVEALAAIQKGVDDG